MERQITSSEFGKFNRHLRKVNNISRQMSISHRYTYERRFCDNKRWKKWKSEFDKESASFVRWSKRLDKVENEYLAYCSSEQTGNRKKPLILQKTALPYNNPYKK